MILASFLFDRGSGFVAVGLSSLLGLYFYVEPAATFQLRHTGEIIRLVTFMVIGLLTASIIEALRKMVDELTQRTDQLITTRAELTEAKQHRALLLADINHRIKNHLASVAGTLAMDRHRVEDEKAKQALDAAISRLSVLGRVYTRLHLSGANVEIDGQAFLQELCTDLSSTVIGLRPVSLSCTLYAINVDAQEAVTLGLVVNELVTNSVKYAFSDGEVGEIRVRLQEGPSGYNLEVRDTGKGVTGSVQGSGTGTKLVRALVGQMRGIVDRKTDGGTVVSIHIPSDEAGSLAERTGVAR